MRKLILILMISILLVIPLIQAVASMGRDKLRIDDVTWNPEKEGFEVKMSSLCGIVKASERVDFEYLIEMDVEDTEGNKSDSLSISGDIKGNYTPGKIDMECNLSLSPPFHYDTGLRKVKVSANAYLISPGGKIMGKEGSTYTKVVNITAPEGPCSSEICLSDISN